jgi:hypothetical protein
MVFNSYDFLFSSFSFLLYVKHDKKLIFFKCTIRTLLKSVPQRLRLTIKMPQKILIFSMRNPGKIKRPDYLFYRPG